LQIAQTHKLRAAPVGSRQIGI